MVTEWCVPSALETLERVGVGGPGHELVVRRARRVGPGARRVDREGAVGAGRPVCATKVAGLSTSLIVSVPLLLMSAAELVSVRLRGVADSTAASLVPRMLMVTEVVVPSALRTVNVSV